MSLFPAYSGDTTNAQSEGATTNAQSEGATAPASAPAPPSKWLENDSFALDLELLQKSTRSLVAEESGDATDDSQQSKNGCASEKMTKTCKDEGDKEISKKRKHSKNKRQASKLKAPRQSSPPPSPLLDFTGKEEFYVDKNKAHQYNAIKTLHKPACPRYRIRLHTLGGKYYSFERQKLKRYYRHRKLDGGQDSGDVPKYPLTENEYTDRMGELNRKTIENCREIQNWLELVELQDRNPYKLSRLRVAEKKIDYLEKALNFHTFHHDLYKVYIATIIQCYTSHDVSKMLDTMLAKDPYSLMLWQAQIMCTQGTMARCTVPEVLRIYERCMKKMFHNQKTTSTSSSSSTTTQATDTVMMQLFYNCSLFLRQSGLYEQFFALIKLAVELNIPANTTLLEDLQPRAQDEQILVEYEELILQSGLPMNEIWLRIEKLRQGFFFLPFPGENSKCSDPQRIVFNEDVCHYVYPLKSRDNSFKLLLLITKLLKVPFIETHCLAAVFEGDTDAIEDLLAVFTNCNYNWYQDHWEFFESLYELSKEMAISPTYLNNSIAHQIYSDCVQKFLTNCAKAYEQIDDRKRLVFLLLWCRFQRLLLLLEKLNKKLTPEFIKQGRQRFKNLLKQRNNRNCLSLYVEFALYEHAADSSLETVENIFINLIEAYNQEENLSSELSYVYLTYAEILLKAQDIDRVCQMLSAYALACEVNTITNARKLAALNAMKEKVERNINIEEHVDIMTLEQHLLPDHTVTQIKIYSLLLYTLHQKQQALEFLQKLLLKFNSPHNLRHQYLREQCSEIYVNFLQLPGGNSYVSHTLVHQSIYQALQDYPDNLFLLQKWGCQASLPWYKLKGGFIKLNASVKSVIYLIALARCRFIKSLSCVTAMESIQRQLTAADLHYHETLVRQRILNLFKALAPSSTTSSPSTYVQSLSTSLQRNALFWRCYLRCLSDQSCSFELGKQCLLTALDECPWSKALYLDGATYVPQELSHLQDLIIEKELRIYALPEELEILRER